MPTVTSATPRSQVILIPKEYVEASLGLAPPELIEETDTWFAVTEANFAVITRNWEDDSAKINGQVRATTHYVTTREGSATLTSWFSPEFFQTLLAVMLQEITSGAASANVAEVQTITLTAVTEGSFSIKFKGAVTPALDWDVTAGDMQTALQALPTIGAGGATVGLVGDVYTVTFAGSMANKPQPTLSVTPYGIDGTIAVATTAQGLTVGIYTHETKFPTKCQLSALSIPIIELLSCPGLEDTQMLYKGAVPTSLSLEVSGQGPIDMTAEFILAGYEEPIPTLPFALPTTPQSVHDCFGNMVTCYLGPLGTEEIPSDALRSLSITMNANIERPDVITQQVEATDLQFGEGSPTLEITMSIKGSKADEYYQYFSLSEFGTRYKFKMVINPEGTGAQARTTLLCNQVLISGVEMTAEGNETQLALTIMPEDNATDDGPGTWTIETPTATYNDTLP